VITGATKEHQVTLTPIQKFPDLIPLIMGWNGCWHSINDFANLFDSYQNELSILGFETF
jgi:hypothetical protein